MEIFVWENLKDEEKEIFFFGETLNSAGVVPIRNKIINYLINSLKIWLI